MPSWLTEEEAAAIQDLDRSTPYVIEGVSQGFFSVARHHGGMTYQGRGYSYIPPTDECVRNDVVKFINKRRAQAKKSDQAIRSGEGEKKE